MSLAGLVFALVLWGVALLAIYRQEPLRIAIPVVLLAGVLVVGSFYVVEDFEQWGAGIGAGQVLAVAMYAGLQLQRLRQHQAR